MLRFTYATATTLNDAVALLTRMGPSAKLIAGGTDLLPQIKEHVIEPESVIALGSIPEMQALEVDASGALRIGALVKMRVIERSPLVQSKWAAVAQGAKLVGSVQIRNLATLGGNICNAAPSADVTPGVIAFGGVGVVHGPNGRREVPIESLLLAPRRTALETGELLIEVRLPEPAANTGSYYLRHTPRQEMDIAVAGSAAVVTVENGRIADARVCLASVAPTPVRATNVEAALRGVAVGDNEAIHKAALGAADDCTPISDVRGSDDYRRHLVAVLTERSVRRAIKQVEH